MTDPHPYSDAPADRASRRRWVLPVSIAGGVAVVAIGAVIAALLLAPAPKPDAAGSPKPTTPASASPSASPKPPAKPSPRVRVDCESVLDRTTVSTYLGGTATVATDTVIDDPDVNYSLQSAAWLQSGGLGCTWHAGDRYLRLTALPLDVIPEWRRNLGVDHTDPTSPLPPVDDPRTECGVDTAECTSTSGTAEVAVVLSDSTPATDTDPAPAFRALVVAAGQRIAAAGSPAPAWVAPYPATVTLPTLANSSDCQRSDIDPGGVMPPFFRETDTSGGAGGGPGLGALENGVGDDSRYLFCIGTPSVNALPFGRWSWDRLRSFAVARDADVISLAHAEEATVRWQGSGTESDYGMWWVSVLEGDAVIAFSAGGTASDVGLRERLVAAADAWLARYAA